MAQAIIPGNAAWMLISASLVFLMTPAVAFFYGGMCRNKSVLNMLMLCTGAIVSGSLAWVTAGWSIAYGPNSIGGFFASPVDNAFLHNVFSFVDGAWTSEIGPNGYPLTIDVAFQMAFAIIAAALIAGAVAERMRFSVWLVFIFLWTLLVYSPIAHMVWGGGFLSADGPIATVLGATPHDFAGGTVIHISAGAAGLIAVIITGNREELGKKSLRPHNLPLVMLGAFLLWFGWFGFNGGSAFGANVTAGYAWVTTTIAASASVLGWLGIERFRDGKWTSLGAASGMVSGLVAITPSADIVSPFGAILIGFITGAVCCLAIGIKYRFGFDDSFDVVAVHLTGGLLGTVLIGFFSAEAGLFYGGNFSLLGVQILIALFALLYSTIVTGLLVFLLHKTLGMRISKAEELIGVDYTTHGETAYERNW
jgi:Amt family ammonium transporter